VTLPNIITLLRLIAVPCVIYLMMTDAFGWAFVLFVLAGISDAVDGAIARHVPGQASELGAWLDPIADKALLVSIFVVLGAGHHLPLWLAMLVVSRDVMIVGGVLLSWAMARPVPIHPVLVSKANTAAQILYVALVLADLGLAWRLEAIVDIVGWVVAALTLASAATYLWAWLSYMQTGAHKP